ncbi:site-specific integrase [uncultured Megasphaera sp.]|uniref:tyrosine-type recombinase/integrase n=1 Tax=uncultured Megasphaera sp. TaxID=165188 RepID=UPI00266D5AC2|nr:site-specific integrase [uncultured Megasphaera sp.]
MAKKRPDGRYKVSVVIDGKRKYFYGNTSKEAQEKRQKYLDNIKVAPNLDESITFGQWAVIWLRGAKSSLSESTFASYTVEMQRYILPALAKRKLIDLQPHMFRELITKLLDQKLSNRTVQYALSVARIALNQAVNDGLLGKSPMHGVKLPKTAKTQVRALTKEEVNKLLSVIHNIKHYNMYWIALYTGLRRSEILGLRMSDINEKDSTITVSQTVLNINNKVVISPTTKNAASRRTISVDSRTLSVIRQQKKITYIEQMKFRSYERNDLLFARVDGHPYDPKYISHTAYNYGKAAGLEHFTFHSLRHTHATLLILAGVHFKAIQYRLGHSTFQQTMDTYGHIIPALEEQVVNKLEGLI